MSGNTVFEVISCVTDNSTLVQKSNIENFNTQSQLIVNESQEALFYKEGQALDLFGPGRHALITEKLPLFKKFFDKLYDGKTPFPCQIFFINKVCVLDVLWGTPAPIVLEDPQYHLIVNVRSSGQCGIRVSDSRRFIVKVVGQLPTFDVESVRRAIKGMMMTSLQNIIANTIITDRIGILEIATRLEELSLAVQKKLNEKLADIGLEAVHFNVGTVFTDDDDLAMLKAAKAKRLEVMNDAELEAYKLETLSRARASARAMEGYTYQEEQKYEVLKTAAGNTAAGGEFVGVGVGLGAGFGMAGEIRNQMGSAMNTKPGTKTCPQCGASADAAAKFCRECGSALAPAKKFCSECGTQCEGTAKFCSVCGNKF
jgi:membrane protease subunit (stomatin/prohibitin family)